MLHILDLEKDARAKVRAVAKDAVAEGYSINLLIDFWKQKNMSILGVMMTTLERLPDGRVQKVELMVGFYDARYVDHDQDYVLKVLDICLDELEIGWDNVNSITCDGGLHVVLVMLFPFFSFKPASCCQKNPNNLHLVCMPPDSSCAQEG